MKLILSIICTIIIISAKGLQAQEMINEDSAIDGRYQTELSIYASNINRNNKYNLRKTGWQVNSFRPFSLEIVNTHRLLTLLDKTDSKLVLELPNNEFYELEFKEIQLQILNDRFPGIQDSSFLYRLIRTWKFRKHLNGIKKSSLNKINTIIFDDNLDFEHKVLNSFSIRLLSSKDTLAVYDFRRVVGIHQESLPTFENSDCEPYDRETIFLRNENAFKKPKSPIRFNPAKFKKIKKTFKINFEQNSAFYPDEKLLPLKNYLDTTEFKLEKVKISAFSSVEGDSINNNALMRKRAEVLSGLLKEMPYEIPDVEFNTGENWELFDNQIEEDSLPKFKQSTWKQLLQSDSVEGSLEYLLQDQRYAEIELFLQRQRNKEELMNDIDLKLFEYIALFSSYIDRRSNGRGAYYLDFTDDTQVLIFRRLLGVFHFAEINDIEDRKFMKYYFDTQRKNVFEDDMILYLFYQPKKFRMSIPDDSLLSRAFEAAKYRIINIADNAAHHKIFYDVQRVIFNQVLAGKLPGQFLNSLNYPDHPSITPYQSNFLRFKNHAKEAGIHILDKNPDEDQQRTSSLGGSHIELLNSEYYLFLKKLVLQDIKESLPNTRIIRTDWYLPFDQFELLWYQIKFWDVERGSILDPDITIQTQKEILLKLLKNSGQLCTYRLEELAVEFFHKLLKYAEINNHATYANEAVDYLNTYYLQNVNYLESKEDLRRITSQLNTVNRFFYFSELQQWEEKINNKLTNKELWE